MSRLHPAVPVMRSPSRKNCNSNKKYPNRPLSVEKLEDRSLLAAVDPPSGLLAWWTGDNTADDLTGRNNGALYSGAGFATGQVADGFNFDGIDDIVRASTAGLPVGNADRTIELWTYIDQYDTEFTMLAAYGTNGVFGQAYTLGIQAGIGLFVTNWGQAIFGPMLDTGRWYHVAATNMGRSFALYIDGSLAASGEMDVDTPSGSVFRIGVQGMRDEVSVYNRALSGSEIQTIYSAGGSGKTKSDYITADFPTVLEGSTDSIVSFTIRRTGSLAGQAAVYWETVDGSAVATGPDADYVSASGTFVFEDGESERTIEVTIKGDSVPELDETFQLLVSTTTPGYAVLNGYATIRTDDPLTKFYVVNDGSPDGTFEYAGSGAAIENYAVASSNSAPRGAASTASGDKVWVIDASKKVSVYSPSGVLLGSWTAGSLPNSADVQGIATNGIDVWIVDAQGDKVHRYTGAASRLSGSQNASSSFKLNSGNRDPSDLVTDGSSIWVLNNASIDRVFKYTVSGTLLGSWTIDGGGGSPTGLTLDPTNISNIWIVDNNTDRLYKFPAVAARTSGTWSPSTSFPLSPGNTNPQGIADPPAAEVDGLTTPFTGSAYSFDSALLAIVGELDGLLAGGKKRK